MQIKDFKLKDETVLEIGKFAILWNLFEKRFCNNNCNPNQLRRISPSLTIEPDALKKLAIVLNARRLWFEMVISDYARRSMHPGNARVSSEENIRCMEQFLKMEGKELVLGCLLIIHRIRNNLMHGLKVAEQLDDQFALFEAVNNVLESVKRGNNGCLTST